MKSTIDMILTVRALVVERLVNARGCEERRVFEGMVCLCDELRFAILIGDDEAISRLFPAFCGAAAIVIFRW